MSQNSYNSDFPAEASSNKQSVPRGWKPLTRQQRRVLGVLIEKSKTTPDVYPMTINSIKNGCNQKSNRSPQMDLQEEQVENVLYELRQLGCVIEVHAGGRVPKYKHQAYDWLAVSKPELGVLAELLLRGEQTIGELRARSARMENEIQGLEDLMPILESLLEKDLIIELTPPGRGQIVTHNLYNTQEKESLLDRFKSSQHLAVSQEKEHSAEDFRDSNEAVGTDSGQVQITSQFPSLSRNQSVDSIDSDGFPWKNRIENLEQQLEQVSRELADLRALIES